MNTTRILFVLLLAFTVGCGPKPIEVPAKHPVVGLWSLHIMEQLDPETNTWNEWRDGMQGYLLYDDDNHMALHLTTTGYEDTELRFPNFTDTIPLEALKYITNSYVYLANYTIDDSASIVQHARISHSNPGDWDEVVQRRFSFIGDTLVLQPVEEERAGLRLKWIKSPSPKS